MTTRRFIEPEQMLLYGVDITSYGRSPAYAQRRMQSDLVSLLDEAGHAAGLNRDGWFIQRKGDEELSAIPLSGNTIGVIDPMQRQLAALVSRHNEGRRSDARLRLRAAVHQGWVTPARNGWAGEAVVTVSRLLNSKPLREAVASERHVEFAVMLSRQVFREQIHGGLTSFRSEDFDRRVIREKEFADEAWLWTYPPAAQENILREDSQVPAAASSSESSAPTQHANSRGSATVAQGGRDAIVISGDGNTFTRTDVGSVHVQGDAIFGVRRG